VGQLGLEFDYKLKKGPATTRNAIALLRYLGYPEEITKQG
jgi:DNA mismatch repair ATPase MutS